MCKIDFLCGRGGIGRRATLRSLFPILGVEVQIFSAAPLNDYLALAGKNRKKMNLYFV